MKVMGRYIIGELLRLLEADDSSFIGLFLRECENDGAVAISDVPFGALRVTGRRRLCELVFRRDRPVQAEASFRAPPAMRKVVVQGHVERGDVGPCLAHLKRFFRSWGWCYRCFDAEKSCRSG